MKRFLKCIGIFVLALCLVLSMMAVMASGIFNRSVLGSVTVGQVETVMPYEISFDEESNIITVSAPNRMGGMAFAGWSDGLRLKMVGGKTLIDAPLTPNGTSASLALVDAAQQKLARSAFGSMSKHCPMELVGGARYASFYTFAVDGSFEENILSGETRTLPLLPQSPDASKLFVGWSDGSVVYAPGAKIAVRKDLTLAPSYLERYAGQFIVLFADQEGHIVKAVRTNGNGKISQEDVPEFWETDSYTYNSWDTCLFDTFSGDTLVTAQGTRKTYLIDTVSDDASVNVTVENCATVQALQSFTVTAGSGKEIVAISVTCDGSLLPVTPMGGIRYSFRMPSGNVKIQVFTKSAATDIEDYLQNAPDLLNEEMAASAVDGFLVPTSMKMPLSGVQKEKAHK